MGQTFISAVIVFGWCFALYCIFIEKIFHK